MAGTAQKMDKMTKLSSGGYTKCSSAMSFASVLLVLSSSSILITAQDTQQLGDLELCPTTCACPVPTPAGEGAEGTASGAVTSEAGNSIVVTRQKCDPNDVETCQANW